MLMPLVHKVNDQVKPISAQGKPDLRMKVDQGLGFRVTKQGKLGQIDLCAR